MYFKRKRELIGGKEHAFDEGKHIFPETIMIINIDSSGIYTSILQSINLD